MFIIVIISIIRRSSIKNWKERKRRSLWEPKRANFYRRICCRCSFPRRRLNGKKEGNGGCWSKVLFSSPKAGKNTDMNGFEALNGLLAAGRLTRFQVSQWWIEGFHSLLLVGSVLFLLLFYRGLYPSVALGYGFGDWAINHLAGSPSKGTQQNDWLASKWKVHYHEISRRWIHLLRTAGPMMARNARFP